MSEKSFDATLTKKEKEAKSYLDWSDATIARCVRWLCAKIKDDSGKGGIYGASASKIIHLVMKEANAKKLKMETTFEKEKLIIRAEIKRLKEKPCEKKSLISG